ncbi:hypothetical protein SRABI27_00516 [Pedobacter sp. Bi27]|uniref:hypothetical protein n=1 Tax=Pedobacter sp. Bi27 TaxID=2822351 RepID=UPI001DDF622C|nr:hypothetical protein [Pedobacter sp. Bi27]CAH0150736.1 hypothetical protein SRABI27_00516 [Pedobacter sp. Bi27]
METTNFTTTILVDQTPKEVFDAVIDPRKWWSGEFKGATWALLIQQSLYQLITTGKTEKPVLV